MIFQNIDYSELQYTENKIVTQHCSLGTLEHASIVYYLETGELGFKPQTVTNGGSDYTVHEVEGKRSRSCV